MRSESSAVFKGLSVEHATLAQAPDSHRLVRWVNQIDRPERRPTRNPPFAPAAAKGGGRGKGKNGARVARSGLPIRFTIQTSWMGSLKGYDDHSYICSTKAALIS